MRASCSASICSLIAALAVLAGCAGGLHAVTDADVATASARWPGTTRADLERGRATYVSRCGGCHALVLPERHTPAVWRDHMARMGPKAHLDAAGAADVLRYLEVAASP